MTFVHFIYNQKFSTAFIAMPSFFFIIQFLNFFSLVDEFKIQKKKFMRSYYFDNNSIFKIIVLRVDI